MNNFKKLRGVQLLIYSAIFFITIFLLCGLWDFSVEGIARLSGRMETVTLPIAEFEKVSLVDSGNGKLLSTDADPQLLLQKSMRVARISFKAEYSAHPGEITVYYTTKDGQGFSPSKRHWFFQSEQDASRYETSLGLKNIKAIRIDPTAEAGNEIAISEITFNSPKSFLGFFAVSYGEIFRLFVYSGILASLMALVQEIAIKKSK